MSYAGILLFVNISIVFLMILLQTITLRVTRYDKTTVAIEFFPLKLILYNFGKNKKKRSFKKRLKRLRIFLFPAAKALRFLLKRAKIVLKELPSYEQKSSEPHHFFIINAAENIIKSYIICTLTYNSKDATIDNNYVSSNDFESISTVFDLELSINLYNLLLANLVFIIYSIKKKGRNKRIVR